MELETSVRTPLYEFVSGDILYFTRPNWKFTRNSMIYPQHIVLDLDNTLIFSTENMLSERPFDHMIDNLYIYHRPYLEDFFEFCFENYRSVNIWSHGDWEWINVNLIQILPQCYWNRLGFVHHREYHKELGSNWIKDMHQVWDDPYYVEKGLGIRNTIIIDDIPSNHVLHPLNLLSVNPYRGDQNDLTLRNIMTQLSQIRYLSDIRDHITMPLKSLRKL